MRAHRPLAAILILNFVTMAPLSPETNAAEYALDLGDGVTLKLTLIPAGTFLMGSPESEEARRKDEFQHRVIISKPFLMGVTPVTVNQFAIFVKNTGYRTDAEKDGRSETFEIKDGKIVVGKARKTLLEARGVSWRDPGFEQKGDHPVVQVSWNDATAFCGWLAQKTGQAVALPTEAQWEYGCRSGTKTAWPWGDHPEDGKGWANGADQSLQRMLSPRSGITCFTWDDGFVFTAPVASFKPNAFGLFDMIGNVANWCQDRYEEYAPDATTDPTGAIAGTQRVIRGGSWNNFAPRNCRSAARYKFAPNYRNERYGFRVVVNLK